MISDHTCNVLCFSVGKDVVLGEKTLCSAEVIAEKRGFWRRKFQELGIKYIVAPMVDQRWVVLLSVFLYMSPARFETKPLTFSF